MMGSLGFDRFPLDGSASSGAMSHTTVLITEVDQYWSPSAPEELQLWREDLEMMWGTAPYLSMHLYVSI